MNESGTSHGFKSKQVGCSTILYSTIHLVLFDNSRMGRFSYMFQYIKKSKLELIEHNLGSDYVRLIPISTFLCNIITFELSNKVQSNIPPVSFQIDSSLFNSHTCVLPMYSILQHMYILYTIAYVQHTIAYYVCVLPMYSILSIVGTNIYHRHIQARIVSDLIPNFKLQKRNSNTR